MGSRARARLYPDNVSRRSGYRATNFPEDRPDRQKRGRFRESGEKREAAAASPECPTAERIQRWTRTERDEPSARVTRIANDTSQATPACLACTRNDTIIFNYILTDGGRERERERERCSKRIRSAFRRDGPQPPPRGDVAVAVAVAPLRDCERG